MSRRTRELLRTLGNWARLSDVTSHGRPDYDARYSGWRALISDKYVKQYYHHQTAESPLLKTLQPDIILKLTTNDLNDTRQRRRMGIILLPAQAGYYYLVFVKGPTSYATLILGVALLGLEQLFFWRLRNSGCAESAADRLFKATREVERNSKFWNDTDYRWNLAADLEMVARDLERIPYAVKSIAPSARRDLLRTSRAKAQAMRDLEIRAIKPKAFTDSDMTKRLAQDMCTILEGCWYELPEKPYDQQVSRWSLALQLAAAFILIGGAIALIGFAAKLGPMASVIATVLIAIALYFLNAAGIPTGITDRYAKIGNEMASGK